MSEADQLQMIDGFFTMAFAEDTETLRQWSPAHALAERRRDRSGLIPGAGLGGFELGTRSSSIPLDI